MFSVQFEFWHTKLPGNLQSYKTATHFKICWIRWVTVFHLNLHFWWFYCFVHFFLLIESSYFFHSLCVWSWAKQINNSTAHNEILQIIYRTNPVGSLLLAGETYMEITDNCVNYSELSVVFTPFELSSLVCRTEFARVIEWIYFLAAKWSISLQEHFVI